MAKNEDSKSSKKADAGGENEERRVGPAADTGGDLKDAGGRSFAPKGEQTKKEEPEPPKAEAPKKDDWNEAVIPATEMRSAPMRMSLGKRHVEMHATSAKVGLVPCEPQGSFCFELAGSTGEDVVVRYRIVDNK